MPPIVDGRMGDEVQAATEPSGTPSVDVVVATHHRPDLLRAALRSIMEQDYAGPVTCLVVFDRAEPDHSLERDDPQRRVRVVTNERTPGLAGARNTGILAGIGDLVAFCDDDDEWLSDKLTRQVHMLSRTPADTVVTGITVEYADREVTRVPTAGSVRLGELVRRRVMEAHPSTVLVRRSALVARIGLVDEDIPGSYGEDYDWILRAAEAGDLAVVEAALVRVRWGQSLFSQQWQTIYEALGYLLDKHPAFRRDPRALARVTGQQAFALAALGERRLAARAAVSTIRTSPRERRAYLALAVASGVVSAPRVLDLAHRRGRGI
jgi:glycosyltransferase involved in cell wall biosynthesis